jgi:beta-xylosidase
MSNAVDPAGPWTALTHVKNVGGWEDPCPFWDEDGQAYLGRSQLGAGPIYLHKMSADGTQLLDNGTKIYEGPVAEGTKIHKMNGYYYMSIPEGGVGTGWQTVLRSTNIYGPYEQKIVLETGSTSVNGPHQGALVDTPEGEWWFYHFQSTEPIGRVVHLQPVTWENGWPRVGVDYDGNGIGEPVKEWTKPTIANTSPIQAPQSSDEFSTTFRGLQWQINHNPVDTHWSLTDRPGYLSLKALKAAKLRDSQNMFTQKVMGYHGEASTEIDCSGLVNGQRAGLFATGNPYNAVGVERVSGQNYIYFETDGNSEQITSINAQTLYFKVFFNANKNKHQFYYSVDNENFIPVKEAFALHTTDWKGIRTGLFSYNTQAASGEAYFNWFHYNYDGPGGLEVDASVDEGEVPADWSMWNELAALVKNKGDGTFSIIQEYDLDIPYTSYTNAVFFDYDNDGNLDLFFVGRGGGWRTSEDKRYARLYRNLGEEGDYLFREVTATGIKQYSDKKYYNMISVGDYDHDGYNDLLIMCYNDGLVRREIDLYKNNGDGTFALQSPGFVGVSNGSVMFGDVDNDGWLDVFYTGNSNGSSTGRTVRIYRNQQDGTFSAITPSNVKGSDEGQSALADINGDGTLDLMITGTGANGYRMSSIYYNAINTEDNTQEFVANAVSPTGLATLNNGNVLIADFNNDGRMDMVLNGSNGSDEAVRVYYQNEQGKFIIHSGQPIFPIREGGIAMGDLNGDGNMDVVIAGYKNLYSVPAYDSPVRIYENRPAAANLNLPPSAPAFVKAVGGNGKLTISWGAATDDRTASVALRYNLYVKNNQTGSLWTLIPADLATGRVKTGTDLQTSLSSFTKEYTLSIPEGSDIADYTVGVQALDQSYAGGLFKTTGVTSGNQPLTLGNSYTVQLLTGGIIVRSEYSGAVNIVNLNGQKIAQSYTNQFIPIAFPGIYIASVNGTNLKIVK